MEDCTKNGGTFITRATNKDECEKLKGCREPGKNMLTTKNSAECSKCQGTLKSIYAWQSGQWTSTTSENLTWIPNGTVPIPANEYVYKLHYPDFALTHLFKVEEEFISVKVNQCSRRTHSKNDCWYQENSGIINVRILKSVIYE